MDLTGAEHPLYNLAGEMARHQWPMAMKEQVIGFRSIAATDDVDVARTGRDHESGLRAGALNQRIDRDGRTVDQFVDRPCVKSAPADAVDNALYQLVWRCQALGLSETTRRVVETDQVGESAVDVDCREDQDPCSQDIIYIVGFRTMQAQSNEETAIPAIFLA
jgi:hypothetical protein